MKLRLEPTHSGSALSACWNQKIHCYCPVKLLVNKLLLKLPFIFRDMTKNIVVQLIAGSFEDLPRLKVL